MCAILKSRACGVRTGMFDGASRDGDFRSPQLAVETQIVVDHAAGREALAGTVVGARAVEARELLVGVDVDLRQLELAGAAGTSGDSSNP